MSNQIFRLLAGIALASLTVVTNYDSARGDSDTKPYNATNSTVAGSTTPREDFPGDGTKAKGTYSGWPNDGCEGCRLLVSCVYLNVRGYNNDPVNPGWHAEDHLRYPSSGCLGYDRSFSYVSPYIYMAGWYMDPYPGHYQCAGSTQCYAATRHHFEGPGTGFREFHTSSDGSHSCYAGWAAPGGGTC